MVKSRFGMQKGINDAKEQLDLILWNCHRMKYDACKIKYPNSLPKRRLCNLKGRRACFGLVKNAKNHMKG